MALTKIINDENKSYRPVLTDKLVLDAKPTVNSFNSITSDAVARAIAGASGEVPQVTENDNGKVLTAIYDDGGAAVEWATAQGGESNVTTSDHQFVVGVNGTGVPITVDCIGGTPVMEPGYITDNGEFKTNSNNYLYIIFDLQLPNNNLGTDTATLTVPEDIDLSATGYGIGTAYVTYWNNSTNSANPLGTITGLCDTANKVIKAGTYTISGANNFPSSYPDGIGVYIPGGGSSDATAAAQALLEEAAPSMTMSRAAQVVTGYKVTPAPYKITDSMVSKDIYALCEAGVENFAYVNGDGYVLPLAKKMKDGVYWLLTFAGWAQGFSNGNGNNMKSCFLYTMSTSTDTVAQIKSEGSFALVPSCTTNENGKVLSVSSGLPTWVNNVPIQVVAALPASPTAGVLYIVTGA